MATPEEVIQSMIELFKKCEAKYDLSEFLSKYPTSYQPDKPICATDIWTAIRDESQNISGNGKSISNRCSADDDELVAQRSAITNDLEKCWRDAFGRILKALQGAAGKGQELEACRVFVPQAARALSEIDAKLKEAKAMTDSEFAEEASTIADSIEENFAGVYDSLTERLEEEVDTQYDG